jgi:starch-binding outer membrane protein, SusD/RagB family
MKNTKLYMILFLALTIVGCEKDFLEVPPTNQFEDPGYWTSEENVKTFAYGFYPAYFEGYGSGYRWGDYFSGEVLNDDFAPSAPAQFTKVAPSSGGGWSFGWVRKANIFIDRVDLVDMDEDAKAHWTGIGRFFRALEYHDLVKRFGDVPWYGEEISEEDQEALYSPRDPRGYVMDQVLEDFRYAAENVRESVEHDGQMVNRSVVLAYMSRVFLFEGTWQKYNENDTQRAAEYLEAAKWAANEVIESGKFSLGDYRSVFNSLSLAGNPEVILYREYEEGILTHALNSYNNKEPQTGPSKDALETYLAEDGLPVEISPLYQGDHGVENLFMDRDGRMSETFVPYELRVNQTSSRYSTSGVATHKFLNEEIADDPVGSSNLNPTDAPIIRYGEVLINYAEAAAELATVGGPSLTQADLDKSINVLRSRPEVNLPDLQLAGNMPAVNGQTYDDPNRDPDVTSIIWEIRRERRVELMMEGFRNDDLRRWGKYHYVDTLDNLEINMGAWIDKEELQAAYPDADLSAIHLADAQGNRLPETATQGYIVPASSPEVQRTFDDPRVYLYPIPLDQIKLYADQGVELKQNPGW